MEAIGIISLVFAIIGLITSIWYVGIIPCAVGIALGIVALTDYLSDKKFAVAGLLISILGAVVSVYMFVSDVDSGRLIVLWMGKNKTTTVSINKSTENIVQSNDGWNLDTNNNEIYRDSKGNDVTQSTDNKSQETPKENTEKKEQAQTQEKNTEKSVRDGVYKQGETANCNGLELTFLGYEESSGTQYNSPSDGKVFVFAEFEVYNGTNEKITMDTWTRFLYYCDGYNVESSTNAIFSMTELDLDVMTGDIVQGGRMRAYLPLELPSNWKEMEIFYKDNYYGDTEFSFEFTR